MASSVDTATAPPIRGDRLLERLDALARIGPIPGGGSARLAFSDEDRAGRDLVVGWMRELGLEVTVDAIGNVVGIWRVGTGAPVMTGSHIDTVRTGGRYDGNLGVLAGLEVIESFQEHGIELDRPLAVAFFSNEEGARYAPDMMGSLVYAGGLDLDEALSATGIDGTRVGEELERIGYRGEHPVPGEAPHAFVELHIEQGPVLEVEGYEIGAVTSVQGISWTEITIAGQSNHAGTTPMSMRHDPMFVVGALTVFVRDLARRFGGSQVATLARVELHPNLVNVVPARAVCTVDLRNTDDEILTRAETELERRCVELAHDEGVEITTRRLARFEPVAFDPLVIDRVEAVARRQGRRVTRLPSGAGHDAQMMARLGPAGMIFVPSHRGISHNPAEHTDPEHLVAGAEILAQVMFELAHMEPTSSGGPS